MSYLSFTIWWNHRIYTFTGLVMAYLFKNMRDRLLNFIYFIFFQVNIEKQIHRRRLRWYLVNSFADLKVLFICCSLFDEIEDRSWECENWPARSMKWRLAFVVYTVNFIYTMYNILVFFGSTPELCSANVYTPRTWLFRTAFNYNRSPMRTRSRFDPLWNR